MSKIQITNEISMQLASLRSAVNASVAFNKARTLSFEDNRNFTSATAYRDAIRQFGMLAESYQTILNQDVENCEQIVANARVRDQQNSQIMFSTV